MSEPLTETVKADALAALDGMREIVRAEMLTTGYYTSGQISNPSRIGSICGGRKHCAIGSLWVGSGIKHRTYAVGTDAYLPGVEQEERDDFLATRPALATALNALNDAALAFAEPKGIDPAIEWRDPIEGLFEGHYGSALTKRDLLGIIAAAKRSIKAAKP